MRSNLKNVCCIIAAVILIAGFVAALETQVCFAGVIGPDAPSGGMTYSEWSARWWQWAFSLPVDENPFFDQDDPNTSEDESCSNGANGQFGPVWFLTGVINVSGTAVRNCTVPAGKLLFFPIINTECSTIEGDPYYGKDEADLRTCVMKFKFGEVFAFIDGVAVKNLDRYLVESPMFTFALPAPAANNVLGLDPAAGQPGQPIRSISRGYYLMVAPLSPGEHVINFGGTYVDFSFSLDITYNLTVTQ